MLTSNYWKCECELLLHPDSVLVCPICERKFTEDKRATPHEVLDIIGPELDEDEFESLMAANLQNKREEENDNTNGPNGK